jgi:hypothetical protein
LQARPGRALLAALLRARVLLGRQEFVVREYPQAPEARQLLSHALLQEGRDWPAAEAALRALLEIDPNHVEGWHNLLVLLRGQGRTAEAFSAEDLPITEEAPGGGEDSLSVSDDGGALEASLARGDRRAIGVVGLVITLLMVDPLLCLDVLGQSPALAQALTGRDRLVQLH